jgi:hypothetical protein
MGLLDFLKTIPGTDADRYLFVQIPPARVSGAHPDVTPLEAGRDYFRLSLCEMCLAQDRQWFSEWYPAVHAIVRLTYGTRTEELPFVAGPLDIPEVSQQNLNTVVHRNRALTPLLPFNGGEIELRAGLLAMKGGDYLDDLMRVLSSVSGLLNVPQVSAGLAVAAPIASSLQTLMTGNSGEPALGLQRGLWESGGGGANPPAAGYFAAVLANEQQLPPAELRVDEDVLKRGADGATSEQLAGHTFMLFRLDKLSQRDDWEGLEALMKPFNDALTALGDGFEERAESLMRAGIAQVLQSPDLTRTDRVRVVRELKDRHDQAADQLGLGAVPGELPALPELMANAPAVDENVSEKDVMREYELLFR